MSKIGPKEAQRAALRVGSIVTSIAGPRPIVTVNRNDATPIVTQGHRKRVHATNAERQRAYRERKGRSRP